MSNIIIISIVPIVIIIYLFLIYTSRQKELKSRRTNSLYTVGLNQMLHKEYEQAIESFQEYLKENTENIDAYIKLGNLLRITGKAQNAVNIHSNLLFRQHLTKEQKISIMMHVCEDYYDLKNFEKSLSIAQEILKLEKKQPWAIEMIWKLYKEMKQWENASDFLNKFCSLNKTQKNRLLAIYKVQDGIDQFYNSGKYHEARLIFRKAIKLDPSCEVPYYYIGASYIKDNREKDAVEWWAKFVETCPEKAYLVFPKLKKILFNLGRFEEIRSFFNSILKKDPENIETNIALAEFYESKGDMGEALSLSHQLVEKHPENVKAKIALAKFLTAIDDCRKANDILKKLINEIEQQNISKCSVCGHQENDVIWLCNNCGEPDTFFNS